MATYLDLASITQQSGFGDLYEKLRVAVVIKAAALLDGVAPTPGQIAWALATLNAPTNAANGVLWYVVAVNQGASIAQILGASDAAVQANVDDAVDVITSA